MKRLGIIGGLGPMATAFFMEMIIEMTDAKADQEHIEMIVYNCPSIPDRTNYLLKRSADNPYPYLLKIGKQIIENGAEIIAIPCVTASCFEKKLEIELTTPIINIIEETVNYLLVNNIKVIGLMATDGTIQCGIFQKALDIAGIKVILPDFKEQEMVMDIIYNEVKANKLVDMKKFMYVSQKLRDKGTEVIILGCTELSVLRRNNSIGADYLDAMQVLAKCVVEKCGKLKKSYNKLITI